MKNLMLLLLLISFSCTASAASENETEPSSTGMTAPGTASPAEATPPAPRPAYTNTLRRDVDTVFAGDDFHQRKETTELVAQPWLKKILDTLWNRKTKEAKPPVIPNFSGFAQILKILVVMVLGLALAWLLWKGWRWLSPYIRQEQKDSAAAHAVAMQSRSLSAQELPETISRMAGEAWKNGDAVTALSLLYRGALHALDKQYHLSLPASATEGECLRLAQRSGKAVIKEGFAPIVRAWTGLAYAGRRPDDFEKLLVLYRNHFDNAATDSLPTAKVAGSAG